VGYRRKSAVRVHCASPPVGADSASVQCSMCNRLLFYKKNWDPCDMPEGKGLRAARKPPSLALKNRRKREGIPRKGSKLYPRPAVSRAPSLRKGLGGRRMRTGIYLLSFGKETIGEGRTGRSVALGECSHRQMGSPKRPRRKRGPSNRETSRGC